MEALSVLRRLKKSSLRSLRQTKEPIDLDSSKPPVKERSKGF